LGKTEGKGERKREGKGSGKGRGKERMRFRGREGREREREGEGRVRERGISSIKLRGIDGMRSRRPIWSHRSCDRCHDILRAMATVDMLSILDP